MQPTATPETVRPTHAKIITLNVLAILVAFVFSLAVVIFFVRRIFIHGKTNFDDRIFNYLQHTVSDHATATMQVLTIFGSQYFLIPAYLILIFYYLSFKKMKWMASRVIAVSVSSLVLMFGLKMLFGRQRPLTPLLHEVSGYSFPSGHAFMSFSFFGLLIYIIYKHIAPSAGRTIAMVLLFLFTIIIGVSRVYLRVHYASDVIAGFCMGFMWLVISLLAMSYLQKRHQKLS